VDRLTKQQREAILARLDNYLMRIPIELNGCQITEGSYVFDVRVYVMSDGK